MADATYTAEQYNTLKKAIASGALIVKYGDKQVTYRSQSEMMSLLKKMETELYPNKNKITPFFVSTSYKKGV